MRKKEYIYRTQSTDVYNPISSNCMFQKIKIMIAEEMELSRKSFAALLGANSELEVVADVSNGRLLVEQLKHKHADIVLMDTEVSVLDGKSALEIIKKRFPEVKVIVLSIHSHMSLMSDYMARGANSYLCKTCSVDTLFRAIKVVKSEGYFFDTSTSKALLESVLREKQANANFIEVRFNERETDILVRICDGKTNKEIANSLHLSSSTIDFYRTKIYGKTKCNNVTGLLKYALKNGIVALS